MPKVKQLKNGQVKMLQIGDDIWKISQRREGPGLAIELCSSGEEEITNPQGNEIFIEADDQNDVILVSEGVFLSRYVGQDVSPSTDKVTYA